MRLTFLVLALSLMLNPGCALFRNPVVVNSGPAVLQTATNLGVRAALYQSKVSVSDAGQIKAYLVDAKALVSEGKPPAHALDQLADLLNSKINNALVKSAIQAAIINLKTQVAIPVDGVLPDNVKVWVLAVLSGAIDGCDGYLIGLQAPAAVFVAPSTISFR